MSTFDPNHSTRERVRRHRVFADFREAAVDRYVRARLRGGRAPIAPKPEPERYDPPVLLTKPQLATALRAGDIRAVRAHEAAMRFNNHRVWAGQAPWYKTSQPEGAEGPATVRGVASENGRGDITAGVGTSGAATPPASSAERAGSPGTVPPTSPEDPLFPLGRNHHWEQIVLYDPANTRAMQNASIVVHPDGRLIKHPASARRFATNAERTAVGLARLWPTARGRIPSISSLVRVPEHERAWVRAMDAAMDAFHKGPPGVLRFVSQVDSYPGEYLGDPDTYRKVPCGVKAERLAIVEAVRAALLELGPIEAAVAASRQARWSRPEREAA